MKQTEKQLGDYYKRKKEEKDKAMEEKKLALQTKAFEIFRRKQEKIAQLDYEKNKPKPLFVNGTKFLPQKSI